MSRAQRPKPHTQPELIADKMQTCKHRNKTNRITMPENKIELHTRELNYAKRANAHLCCAIVPPDVGLRRLSSLATRGATEVVVAVLLCSAWLRGYKAVVMPWLCV